MKRVHLNVLRFYRTTLTSRYGTNGPCTSREGPQTLLGEDIVTSDWYDERNGTHKALHAMNRVRVPWIVDILSLKKANFEEFDPAPLKGLRILDVGCGGGILSIALARLGANVTGLDLDASALDVATKVSQRILPPEIAGNVQFSNEPIERFQGESFDACVASEVVEHVEHVPTFVASCSKLVRPNGRLFFTTINRTLLSNLFAIKIAEDVLKLLPKGLHSHEKFVTPTELRSALLDQGCRVGPTFGLLYNPLTNSWNWSNFAEVNYALVATKC